MIIWPSCAEIAIRWSAAFTVFPSRGSISTPEAVPTMNNTPTTVVFVLPAPGESFDLSIFFVLTRTWRHLFGHAAERSQMD